MEKNPWFGTLIVILVLVSAWFLASQVWSLIAEFSGIIMVLFLAWLLAFILNPLASFLCRLGVPRVGAVALVYTGLLLAIVLSALVVVPLIVAQLAQIGERLPEYAEQLPGWIAPLQSELNRRNIEVDLYSLYRSQDLPAQVRDIGTLLVENTINLATGLASVFLNTIIVLVISFYFMLDGERIVGVLLDVVPDSSQEEARFLLESVDRKFGGFLRGQLIQALIYGFGTAIVMAWANLDFVLVASLFSGVLMFIPFFGPILGLIPPVVIALLSTPFTTFLIVLGALLVLQQVVLNVIAPKVMADAVGMHPILVFLAILLGIKVAGPLGAIFGVPVVAVINAMVQLFYNRSESIQRRRAVRLGLSPTGDLAVAETAPSGDVDRWRTAINGLGVKLSSQRAKLASRMPGVCSRRNGGQP